MCNHFSIELPDGSQRFLLNPRGLLWSEVQAGDIVMVDAQGRQLAGRHPVEPTAMFIHAAVHRIARQPVVLHTHMPYATAITMLEDGRLQVLGRPAREHAVLDALDRDTQGLLLRRRADRVRGRDMGAR